MTFDVFSMLPGEWASKGTREWDEEPENQKDDNDIWSGVCVFW